MKFIKLFHKSSYEFHENRIKKEEVSADVGLESKDSAISDIVSKIFARIRSLINLDREVKKEDKEGSEHKKPNFLKVIDNFFQSFFNSTKKTQWQEQGKVYIHSDKTFSTTEGLLQQRKFKCLELLFN